MLIFTTGDEVEMSENRKDAIISLYIVYYNYFCSLFNLTDFEKHIVATWKTS